MQQATRMKPDALLDLLDAGAYTTIDSIHGRDASSLVPVELGCKFNAGLFYRRCVVWSEPDDQPLLVIFSRALRSVVIACTDDQGLGLLNDARQQGKVEEAKLQVQAYKRGYPAPPYEALFSWVTPEGSPQRRLCRIQELVDGESTLHPGEHRPQIEQKAVELQGMGTGMRVTVRCVRSPRLIRLEFDVPPHPEAVDPRWVDAARARA